MNPSIKPLSTIGQNTSMKVFLILFIAIGLLLMGCTADNQKERGEQSQVIDQKPNSHNQINVDVEIRDNETIANESNPEELEERETVEVETNETLEGTVSECRQFCEDNGWEYVSEANDKKTCVSDINEKYQRDCYTMCSSIKYIEYGDTNCCCVEDITYKKCSVCTEGEMVCPSCSED